MSEKTMKLRHLPGTKVDDLYKGWPKLALSEMEGTLAVQQYLETIRRTEPNNTTIVSEVPPGQDEAVWQYEWLRIFTLELNLLAVRLDSECSIESCKQMKASDEWLYLCAAHKTPQECSAVDYIRHTLDGTAALLNSNKWFPSRVSIPQSSLKYFQSIARRLYRIFAHAYFHHRTLFLEFENETHICERFVRFSVKFDLIPSKLLIIPMSVFGDNHAQ